MDLQDEMGLTYMFVTHDLGVVKHISTNIMVTYLGKCVELGTSDQIFENPCHPYTIGLMASKPVVNKKVDRLYSIPGSVPNPINMPNYCYFRDRCEKCTEKCNGEYPHEVYVSPTHMVTCYLYEDKKED
jgi:peptide/nickel transport system ATP-binding protein